MIDHVAEFEKAKELGWHAYELKLKGIPPIHGVSTAYVDARTPEEARAKVAEQTDPAEEEIGEVSLQTLKFGPATDGCPCVTCDGRRRDMCDS